MSAEKKVPEIRFKGFSGEWEERQLNNEVKLFSGLTYSPKDIRKEGVFVIRSSNVKNGQLVQADNVYVNPEVVNCSNVIQGDIIVVVRNGSKSLIGKHAQVNLCMANTVIGAFMTGIRSRQPEFVNALFDTNHFTVQVDKNLGATINQITNGAFKSMVFMFPKKNEQTAIGNYFQKLDSLINQHQQKHDQLSNIKKAMLEKMFPKQGENTPEIRFKGFSGEWEERTLGEVFTYERSDSYIVESVDYSDEYSTPVLTANKGFLLGYTNEEATYNNPSIIFDDFTLDSKFVDFPYMVKSSAIKILTVKDDKKYDLMFAFNLLNTTRIEVMGHARHYIGVVQNTKVAIPNKSEQTAIGNYFQKLDTLISQHQNQITKLNNIKQACLSKMFV